MNKIKEFLTTEKNNLKAERKEKESNIYRCEINIASIDDAIKKLELQVDNTINAFKPADNNESDEMREIRLLKERRESLQKDIDVMKKRVVIIDNRLDKIGEVDKEVPLYDVNGYKMLSIRESERQRIARDIHDSVVQKMTALVHKSEFVQMVMDSDSQRAKLELEVINKTMRECIDELRDIIYDLRPMALDDVGFKTTLSRYINQCESQTDMNITIDMEDLDESFVDDVIGLSVFRIIQELTSNSIKYSKGNNINISVSSDNNEIVINHKDDGKGYDDDAVNRDNREKHNSGFGLAIIKERVKLLNGVIDCSHDSGTCNIIRIPCVSHTEEESNE